MLLRMAQKGVKARKLLRFWRESQNPRVTQEACGRLIGKSGALIRLFETGRADLLDGDCVALHRATGIPLRAFFGRARASQILRTAEILQAEAAA